MVFVTKSRSGPEIIFKRGRINRAPPSKKHKTLVNDGTLITVPQTRVERHRKQKLMTKLNDSGFEDFPSPSPSPAQTVLFSVCPAALGSPVQEQSNWHYEYGDIGYKIQKEKEMLFNSFKCLASQPQVTADARCTLVSWLIPVHKHFCLSFECCCLTVDIIDRFLASTPVAADCFQLLGVTALLLASKQVEVFSPQISQLLSLCCNTFNKEQLCNLECLILLRLNFRLAAPTIAFFLDYLTNHSLATLHEGPNTDSNRLARKSLELRKQRQYSNLARGLCELSLADYTFNKYPPSLKADCALKVASEIINNHENEKTIQFKSMKPLPVHLQEDKQSLSKKTKPKQRQLMINNDYAQSVGSYCLASSELASTRESLAIAKDDHTPRMNECIENLKQLVSLNQELLHEMMTL